MSVFVSLLGKRTLAACLCRDDLFLICLETLPDAAPGNTDRRICYE
jgi:hypothetical protein